MAGKRDPSQFPLDDVVVIDGSEVRRDPRETARGFRELFERGRKQYGATNSEIAWLLQWDDRTVANLLTHGRPLKYKKAKALLRALITCDSAVTWRQKNGCHFESADGTTIDHRSGEQVWCGAKPPCDPWFAELRQEYSFGSWLYPTTLREAPKVIIPPREIEQFAYDLAEHLAQIPEAKLKSKRPLLENGIAEFLRKHGAKMAYNGSWDLQMSARYLVHDVEIGRSRVSTSVGEKVTPLLEQPPGDFVDTVIGMVVAHKWPAEQWVKRGRDIDRAINFMDLLPELPENSA